MKWIHENRTEWRERLVEPAAGGQRLILRSPCYGLLVMTLIGIEEGADGKHLGKDRNACQGQPPQGRSLGGQIPTFPLLVPAKSHDVAKVGFYMVACIGRILPGSPDGYETRR